MKNKFIIAIALLGLAFASCKKVYNYPQPEENKVTVSASENYNNSAAYISQNNWKVVEREDGDENKITKMKLNVVGTNNYIIVDPVDPSKYWKPEYFKGQTLTALQVTVLLEYVARQKK